MLLSYHWSPFSKDREINSRLQVPLPPCSETISQAAVSIWNPVTAWNTLGASYWWSSGALLLLMRWTDRGSTFSRRNNWHWRFERGCLSEAHNVFSGAAGVWLLLDTSCSDLLFLSHLYCPHEDVMICRWTDRKSLPVHWWRPQRFLVLMLIDGREKSDLAFPVILAHCGILQNGDVLIRSNWPSKKGNHIKSVA